MGTVYKVKCICGHETGVEIGDSRWLCRQKKYMYPVLCRDCGKIGSSVFSQGTSTPNELGVSEPVCCHCQSTNITRYDHPSLRKVIEDDLPTAGFADPRKNTELTNGLYFCPVCKNFSLSFEDTGPVWC